MIGSKFRSLRIAVALLFALTLTASLPPGHASGSMSTVTVDRTSVTESYIGDDNHFTLYATSDGREAFSYDLTKDDPESGTELSLTNEWDPGVQYILDTATSVKAEAEFHPYITQAAIWWYRNPDSISSGFTGSDKEAYVGLRNEIVMLVNRARAAAVNQPSKSDYFPDRIFTVTTDASESFHSVKRDGLTYYETPTVQVEWDGSAPTEFVDVSPAVDGVTVAELDESPEDNSVWSFFGSEDTKERLTFRLRVPESLVDAFLQNPAVTFQCKASVNLMQVYESNDKNMSRMVTLDDGPTAVNLEFSRTLDPTSWNAHEEVAPSVPFGVGVVVGIALLFIVIAIASRILSRRR